MYYPFNGQAVAMKQGADLYYLHRDQVGSVVAVSDASGNEVGSARYWPFGGARLTTGVLPIDRLFTGQIRDLGDDRFYFFKARYYDATIGKFVQPDRVVQAETDPQALNRYAYARNNPLRLTDPTGHAWEDDFSQAHNGRAPTAQDRFDRDLSVASGVSWSSTDWSGTYQMRQNIWSLVKGSGDTGASGVGGSDTGPATLPLPIFIPGFASAIDPMAARGKKQIPAKIHRMSVEYQKGTQTEDSEKLFGAAPGAYISKAEVYVALEAVYLSTPLNMRPISYPKLLEVEKKVDYIVIAGGTDDVGRITYSEWDWRGDEYRFDVNNWEGHNLDA